MRPAILILALAVAIPWATPADARTEKAPPPSIGVVPFVNEPGDPMAVQVVQSEVVAHLTKLGFVVEGNGRIDAYLRKNRVRARNAMPRDMAKELAEMLGVRYLLFGTVTHWEQNRGPQVGITARIVEPERGLTLWAHAVSLDAPEAPGVLTLGRPKALPPLAHEAVGELFKSLDVKRSGGVIEPSVNLSRPSRSLLAAKPIAYQDRDSRKIAKLRVAVLPFENRTSRPEGSAVVAERVLHWLLSLSEFEVVDPGEVRRALIQEDLQPLLGLKPSELRILKRSLGVDAVLDGTVLAYENGGAPTPKIDLFARIRATDTGATLWSATTSREGDDTRTLYDAGRIQGIDELADAVIGELLTTWR